MVEISWHYDKIIAVNLIANDCGNAGYEMSTDGATHTAAHVTSIYNPIYVYLPTMFPKHIHIYIFCAFPLEATTNLIELFRNLCNSSDWQTDRDRLAVS